MAQAEENGAASAAAADVDQVAYDLNALLLKDECVLARTSRINACLIHETPIISIALDFVLVSLRRSPAHLRHLPPADCPWRKSSRCAAALARSASKSLS